MRRPAGQAGGTRVAGRGAGDLLEAPIRGRPTTSTPAPAPASTPRSVRGARARRSTPAPDPARASRRSRRAQAGPARGVTAGRAPARVIFFAARDFFRNRARRADTPGMTRNDWQRAVADDRGAASVEYVVLLATVSLGVAAAVAALAIPMIERFRWMRALINLPFP
ncbi:MAG: hypothetical protein D6689_21030 [Deltaproteobacteria bacterium]|nr:MAG: hypothetical protein D6689_21030 [Deltaproteobacteria bacterium]